MQLAIFLVLGVLAGMLAGMFGVGGGVIIVPALVIFSGYTQQAATGTSLVALLGPVDLGGVYAFYRAGLITNTNIKAGLLIALGMFLGSYLGGRVAVGLSEVALKRAFALFLLVMAARTWYSTV